MLLSLKQLMLTGKFCESFWCTWCCLNKCPPMDISFIMDIFQSNIFCMDISLPMDIFLYGHYSIWTFYLVDNLQIHLQNSTSLCCSSRFRNIAIQQTAAQSLLFNVLVGDKWREYLTMNNEGKINKQAGENKRKHRGQNVEN